VYGVPRVQLLHASRNVRSRDHVLALVDALLGNVHVHRRRHKAVRVYVRITATVQCDDGVWRLRAHMAART
jgi:hypothetical protein